MTSEAEVWQYQGMVECAVCSEALGGPVWHADEKHKAFCIAEGARLDKRRRLIIPALAPEGMRIELVRLYGYRPRAE